MGWDLPILTDSGGYQVFSLAKLRSLSEEGAEFSSHIDGSRHFITPEKAIEIQEALGSDIMMAFDECVHYPAVRDYVEQSLDLTTRWAKRSKDHLRMTPNHSLRSGLGQANTQFLFGIVQGGTYLDLRKRAVEQLLEIGFDGYAIGGVSVGEGGGPRKGSFFQRQAREINAPGLDAGIDAAPVVELERRRAHQGE